jgi:hypothetical protein
MIVRVYQGYVRTVYYSGTRSAEVEVEAMEEARKLFAERKVDWDYDLDSESEDCDEDIVYEDPEFEKED